MTGPALLIGVVTVLLTNLVRLGAFDVLRLAAAVGLWFLAVALVFAAGWVLTRRGNFTKTLRALGFAQSIYALVGLCPLSAHWDGGPGGGLRPGLPGRLDGRSHGAQDHRLAHAPAAGGGRSWST